MKREPTGKKLEQHEGRKKFEKRCPQREVCHKVREERVCAVIEAEGAKKTLKGRATCRDRARNRGRPLLRRAMCYINTV